MMTLTVKERVRARITTSPPQPRRFDGKMLHTLLEPSEQAPRVQAIGRMYAHAHHHNVSCITREIAWEGEKECQDEVRNSAPSRGPVALDVRQGMKPLSVMAIVHINKHAWSRQYGLSLQYMYRQQGARPVSDLQCLQTEHILECYSTST
jgi:hypothetical protein